MEQLASKTMETDSFIIKTTLTDVLTSLNHVSLFLHHITSSYIILHHESTKERRKIQTGRKLDEILSKPAKLANSSYAQRP